MVLYNIGGSDQSEDKNHKTFITKSLLTLETVYFL